MIQTLNIKGFNLLLDNSEQLSPQGRPIRLSSTESVGNGRFINRVLCTGTIHWFRFLDVYSEFIGFEFDECGNYLRKC
jgi:hypothetical protein